MAGYTSNYKRKSAGITYEQIIRDVQAGNIKPVYYLMGDESYYIDRLADFIVNAVLKPEEQDFNLMTFFGAEADIDAIIAAARSYPMAAQHLVIVVKEAQGLKNLSRLEYYFHQIQPSTVLIFCHKNGTIDRRQKVAMLINKEGVLFESKKLYDNQLAPFVQNYLRRKHFAAGPGAAEMVADFIGSDLNRIASELDKLILALPKGEQTITVDWVKEHIGISKNFNNFELVDALANKDVLKANRIAKYFDANARDNPIQATLSLLFKQFSQVMLAFYAPEKNEPGIAAWLGMTEWQVRKNILPMMSNYSAMKVMYILGEIRRTDARSKGSEGSHTTNGDLLKELIYFILH